MATWKNLDTLETFKALSEVKRVKLAEAMSGAEGAERVKKYSVPMAEGFSYNFAAKQVDDEVLGALKALAEEAQLAEKFEELYNGAVMNTGENRLVLHQLTRGQLGNEVEADGVDKREFYVNSRRGLQNLPIKYITAKLPMPQARSLQRLYRLVSAAAI